MNGSTRAIAPLGVDACTGLEDTAFVERALEEKTCAAATGSKVFGVVIVDKGARRTAAISGNVTSKTRAHAHVTIHFDLAKLCSFDDAVAHL